jgi:Protein of unknown function (DUF1572)
MPDSFITHYLDDAIHQFRSLKDLADRAMAQIGDEDLTTVLDAEANSIAVLMKHMAGSMRARWTSFPSSAEGQPERRRDSEFMIEGGDTRRALFEQWEASWQFLFRALERLTPEDMTKAVHIRGKSFSVIAAINRQLTHYAYHVGQIVFLAKHFQSSAWQSLSIPRGKSEEFIAAAQNSREA